MSADDLTLLSRGMPASLTPRLLDRLIARATARLGAERVTTRAPYDMWAKALTVALKLMKRSGVK